MDNVRLYNGDSFDVLEQQLQGEYIPLIVTDPPYLIPNLDGGGYVAKRIKGMCDDLAGAAITEGYDIGRFADIVERLQQGNINAYFFCNKLQIPEYLAEYVGRRKCKFDLISWHKTNVPPTYSNKYLPDTEYVLFFHRGKGHTFPNGKEDAATWYVSQMNVEDKHKYGHPTPKPVPLLGRLIRNSSAPGDVVLDPFMGSGSTGVAAMRLGRKFVGVELNNTYYRKARERLASNLQLPFE